MKAKRAAAGPVEGPWALPDGWRWERLGDVAELIRGVTYAKPQVRRADDPQALALLRGNNIQSGALSFDDLTYVDERCIKRSQMIRAGDIVLTMSSGSIALIGKSGWATKDLDRTTFGAFCGVVRSNRIKARLLFYFLQTDHYRRLIGDLAKGTNINNLKHDHLVEMVVPVPPERMQDAIVARIDELFAEVDDGEAALARARGDLATWRKALLKAAVTGDLTADWRAEQAAVTGDLTADWRAERLAEDGPPAETGATLLTRLLADRRTRWEAEPRNKGKRYKEPLPPAASDMPPLPDGWTWTTAEALSAADSNAIVIGPFGSDLKTSDYREAGVPLVFVRHIRSSHFAGLRPQFIDADKAQQLASHVARAGDVLITKMGDPPGDAAIYPADRPEAVITADCIRWRLGDAVPASFVTSWINSQPGRRWIAAQTKGVAQQKITLAIFRTMPVPLPPKAEIAQIVSEVERLTAEVEAASDDLTDMREAPATLRQSILAAAFRGELA